MCLQGRAIVFYCWLELYFPMQPLLCGMVGNSSINYSTSLTVFTQGVITRLTGMRIGGETVKQEKIFIIPTKKMYIYTNVSHSVFIPSAVQSLPPLISFSYNPL
ncbi:unnamed protein product [Choristocarpus tenellus]